jgi:hypothetical protein
MRRNEEGLGYWLSSAPSSPGGQGLAPGLKNRLLARLRGLQSRTAIKEQSLEIGTSTVVLDSELNAGTHVQDGLGALALTTGITGEIGECASEVTDIDLLQSTVVLAIVCPNERVIRVADVRLLPVPNTRFFTTNLRPGMLRAVGSLRTAQVNDGNPLLLAQPYIRGRMSQIAAIPHRRASMDIGRLQDSERREFLNEAQILKGIRFENAEVIAVFRHVPIEMITRLRYLENQQAIVYSVSGGPRRTRTRVHDMAVVRDKAKGEIHLIPRRTHVNLELRVTNGELRR